MTGSKHMRSLHEPSEAEIRAWAAVRRIPILEIDPVQVDTARLTGWYQYWGRLPLTNGLSLPLVISDVDRDDCAEVFGTYRNSFIFQTQIYKIDSNGIPTFLFRYPRDTGAPLNIVDSDLDSLKEAIFDYASILNFEQPTLNSLPTAANYRHPTWERNFQTTFAPPWIGYFDDDSTTDLLYKGSECDFIDTSICNTKVYVAEYDQHAQNFVRVWSTDFGLGGVGGVGGFAVDDFDGDEKREFAVAELITYRVFVVENMGDNRYAWTWQGSTPFTNSYYTVAGDVDHDGRPEFFIGATANGSWTTMYEADSNNYYSPKFIIHLLSGGLFDEPTYLTTDVDGDGILELVIMSGNYLYIFKSRQNDEYFLWYLKRENTKDAVQFYDFNHDGKKDFIVSKLGFDSLGRAYGYADYYRATSLVTVPQPPTPPFELSLKQNYPNPFNPSTSIEYSLPLRKNVRLELFNILGQRIATLVDEEKDSGNYVATWNAAGMASGIYFCRLTIGDKARTIKMLLIP
jgi:hypothetical protein